METWRFKIFEIPESLQDSQEAENGVYSGSTVSLEATPNYIIFAHNNGSISMFDRRSYFSRQRNLIGHAGKASALAALDDTLVSGGVDQDLRVWNISTGYIQIQNQSSR
jgi:hypothetical protein